MKQVGGTKTVRASASTSTGVERPVAPSPLLPKVLQEVKLRGGDGRCPPPPMPAPVAGGGGFPQAPHRSVKRYLPKGAMTKDTAPVEEHSVLQQWNDGTFDGVGGDPLPDKVLEDELVEERSLVAAAAVLLRSSAPAQRSGCLAKLLETADLDTQLADADPTCAAQFILALRLALDSQTASHQADAVLLTKKLTQRCNESGWLELLELTSRTGSTPPLASWLDERTLFGLGRAELSQPGNPVARAPSARLWDPLESIHELASVVKCEVLDGFAKTQYAPRLRYLLLNPPPGIAWVPRSVLSILHHLVLSKTAGEAVAATPGLVDAVAGLVEPKGSSLSEAALLVLNGVAKGSDRGADAVKAAGGFERAAEAVLGATSKEGEEEATRHARAALRVVRTGVLCGRVGSGVVPGLFGSVAMLARAGVAEAVLLVEAHGVVHGLSAHQSVGFLDFAGRDCPAVLHNLLTSHPPTLNLLLFASAVVGLLRLVIPATPATPSWMQHVSDTARWLVDLAVLDRPLPDFRVFSPHVPHECSRPNAVRWPEVDGERVAWAALRAGVVELLLDLRGGKLAAAATATASCLREVCERYSGTLQEAAEVLPGLSLQHARLPKRDSRQHAAIVRSEVRLLAFLGAVSGAGDNLSLTLYLQPADAQVFSLLAEKLFDGYPRLRRYFEGALPALEPRGFRYSFCPGRLEPQPEWLYLPLLEGSESGRGLLQVRTRYGVGESVLAEWASWSSELPEDCFAFESDWREACLRCAAVGPGPFLSRIVAKRASSPGWASRLGEDPLQLVQRALHAYQSSGGGPVFSAVVLSFLDPDFPKDCRRAAEELLAGSPQLAAMAGKCFEAEEALPLFLGLHRYLAASEAAEEAAATLARGVDPTNLLHLRAVHVTSDRVFAGDAEPSFDAVNVLQVLSPPALRCVVLYAAPTEEELKEFSLGKGGVPAPKLFSDFLRGRLADPLKCPTTAARLNNVHKLNLRSFDAAFASVGTGWQSKP